MIIIIDTLSWKETSLFGSNARKLVHEKSFQISKFKDIT